MLLRHTAVTLPLYGDTMMMVFGVIEGQLVQLLGAIKERRTQQVSRVYPLVNCTGFPEGKLCPVEENNYIYVNKDVV